MDRKKRIDQLKGNQADFLKLARHLEMQGLDVSAASARLYGRVEAMEARKLELEGEVIELTSGNVLLLKQVENRNETIKDLEAKILIFNSVISDFPKAGKILEEKIQEYTKKRRDALIEKSGAAK